MPKGRGIDRMTGQQEATLDPYALGHNQVISLAD